MRFSPKASIILHDIVMIVMAWELAWLARFNFHLPSSEYWWANLKTLPLVIIVQAAITWRFGLYRGLWRFASTPDLWNIIRSTLLGVVCITILLFIFTRLEDIPRSLVILYPVFLVFFLGGPRLAYRLWKDHSLNLRKITTGPKVLIIGAGFSGEALVRDMFRIGGFRPIGFIDDLEKLQNRQIQGVPVLGPLAELQTIAHEHEPDIIIIAIPTATNQQMQEIVTACELTGVNFRTLPKAQDITSGSSYISEVRDVLIEDLLSRDKVELDWQFISQNLAGKIVMVTGGGGSIGSELCRQIARLGPASLIVLEHSEYNLYEIEQELGRLNPALKLSAILGNVTDRQVVDKVLEDYSPEVIFHAAAYKHVPLLQDQIRVAVRNNIIGTLTMAEAASKHGVGRFVLISTDKAVNPTSVMGMSKRIAEMVCENMNSQSQTRFITVRFGNVLGSAGSVVPIFRRQINKGGPVTITHPEMTRYFMTIPEASQLILQAGALGEGGEIFILEMGEPVKITFLAEQMIRLMGKVPGEDIEISYTGLRPGEKLFEELFHDTEAMSSTKYDKILLARHREVNPDIFEQQFNSLLQACENFDDVQMRASMRSLVPESLQQDSQAEQDNVIALQKK